MKLKQKNYHICTFKIRIYLYDLVKRVHIFLLVHY